VLLLDRRRRRFDCGTASKLLQPARKQSCVNPLHRQCAVQKKSQAISVQREGAMAQRAYRVLLASLFQHSALPIVPTFSGHVQLA
jgi:hypothetical protein